MIQKFIKIKNIGRYRDFSSRGDLTFDKVNIIYGENSQGKTTLVSIIRSLISKDIQFITKRKSFRSNNVQNVELLFKLNNSKNFVFKFQNNGWNSWCNDLKNVEIFDEIFIDKNIYTGLNISSEHYKFLYQFAIGEEGVELVKKIEVIKKDLQNKYIQLNSLRDYILILTDNYFGVDDFIGLSEDKEINRKIEEKKQEIAIAEKSKEIREKQFLNEISSLELPFDVKELKNLLQKSLVSISKEALQKVQKHINELSKVIQLNSELWLYQGLKIIEKNNGNKCPLCQQDLKKSKEIIKSYQQYFNNEYKKLKKNLNECLEEIENSNFKQLLNEIKTIDLQNAALIEFWRHFLPDIEFFNLQNLEKDIIQSAQFFDKVKLLINNKSKNILEPLNVNDIDRLSNSINKLNQKINDYNFKIISLNKKIKEIKEKQPKIDSLKSELKKLEISKRRFSDNAKELCNEYQKLKNEIEQLKKQIEQMKVKLINAISQKVENYGEKTNEILDKFGLSFKIIEQRHKYRGKGEEPYYEYYLESGGCRSDPLQDTKFTLSGGDRNAIALAFFLAKIFLDRNIEEKIVIFDDPISSFDMNRKRRTIEFIKEISQRAKQLIILTHINTFAFELWDALREVGIKPKSFQIIDGNIKEWNVNEEKKPPFFKNLSALENFVSDNNKIDLEEIEEIRRLIRICLEDKLTFGYFQFFKDFNNDYWLGDMVKRLRELENDQKLNFKYSNNREVINELENLCDFSAPSHHGNIVAPYKTSCSLDEVKNYVKLTLRLIYEWL